MKVKISSLLFVCLIALFLGGFLFLNKSLYRSDCEKSLDGYKILYVYSIGCPHCHAELKRLKDLKLLGNFYMVKVEDTKCQKIIDDFKDFIIFHKNSNYPDSSPGIFTPTKLCLRTNYTFIGEMKGEELINFYKKCVGEIG